MEGENVLSINQVLCQLALYYTKEVLFSTYQISIMIQISIMRTKRVS